MRGVPGTPATQGVHDPWEGSRHEESIVWPRVALDLENKDDLHVLKADRWRIVPGLVPGEPNQGLVAERRGSPARRADYDDSGWPLGNIQERRSVGFTFAWYRLRFTMPETVKGQAVASSRVFFECNVDNDGGRVDRWGD